MIKSLFFNCVIVVEHTFLEPWIKKSSFVQELLDPLIIMAFANITADLMNNLFDEPRICLFYHCRYILHNWKEC